MRCSGFLTDILGHLLSDFKSNNGSMHSCFTLIFSLFLLAVSQVLPKGVQRKPQMAVISGR